MHGEAQAKQFQHEPYTWSVSQSQIVAAPFWPLDLNWPLPFTSGHLTLGSVIKGRSDSYKRKPFDTMFSRDDIFRYRYICKDVRFMYVCMHTCVYIYIYMCTMYKFILMCLRVVVQLSHISALPTFAGKFQLGELVLFAQMDCLWHGNSVWTWIQESKVAGTPLNLRGWGWRRRFCNFSFWGKISGVKPNLFWSFQEPNFHTYV